MEHSAILLTCIKRVEYSAKLLTCIERVSGAFCNTLTCIKLVSGSFYLHLASGAFCNTFDEFFGLENHLSGRLRQVLLYLFRKKGLCSSFNFFIVFLLSCYCLCSVFIHRGAVGTVVPAKSDGDVILCLQLLSKIQTCTLHLC